MPPVMSNMRNVSALLAGLILTLAAPAATAAEAVDLELVLATDTSGSIDWTEAGLQREGIAAAFRSQEVVTAIKSGALGKIAVVYLDWSNQFDNTVVVSWTRIHDEASAAGFSEALLSARPTYGRRTSISSAIVSAMELLETNDYEGSRRTIDISGDGPNNFGLSLAPVRDEALAKGITINGLPIITANSIYSGRNTFADIDQYYANCVIGGPGSFAIVARGFEDFALAIRRKLILEISELVPGEHQAAGRLIPAAAHYRLAQALPSLPRQGPDLMRPPETRGQNCDLWGFGGGFGGFR